MGGKVGLDRPRANFSWAARRGSRSSSCRFDRQPSFDEGAPSPREVDVRDDAPI